MPDAARMQVQHIAAAPRHVGIVDPGSGFWACLSLAQLG